MICVTLSFSGSGTKCASEVRCQIRLLRLWLNGIGERNVGVEVSWYRKKLIPFQVGLLCLGFMLFIPPVWNLRSGHVIQTIWTKSQGKKIVKTGPSEKSWVPYRKISLHFIHAILVSEDERFFSHRGLDFYEIWESFLTNIQEGRFARGASTITQQVVKIAFLSRDKTIVRKLREMAGALLLELILSKEEILSWYLNLIELGDGVLGVGEGSRHYFQTNAELLNVIQSVHLALILPGPNRWSRGLRRHNLTRFGHRRFGIILNKMLLSGYVTKFQWEQAMASGNFGSPVQPYPVSSGKY